MFIFKKRKPAQVLNDLDAYLSALGTEPIELIGREIQRWGEISYSELEEIIRAGLLDEYFDWQGKYSAFVNETLNPLWTSAFLAAAERATRGKIILSDSDLDVRNWLATRGGEFITSESAASRRAIAAIVAHETENLIDPRRLARQIRPLIGLTEAQSIANLNYRERLRRELIQGGMNQSRAEAQSERAALRYATSQHRYRAETIAHTELAFAYNRGAHAGVRRAISGGLMGRCAMIWTTAGTNRVCGRCMDLKDTIVGYTDESGVTLPPLHPRCRCAIRYDEVGEVGLPSRETRTIPMQDSNSSELVPRTLTEAKNVADRLNPVVGKYFVRKSKWSGRVTVSKRGKNSKNPNCSIEIDTKDCPNEAILHELVHSYSTSYYSLKTYQEYSAIEEASVQYLTQEIAKRDGIELAGSGYDFWVDKLRRINQELGLYDSDLKFARRLLRVPMSFREEWLFAKVRKSAETLEQMIAAMDLLNKLTWEALENGLSRLGTADK